MEAQLLFPAKDKDNYYHPTSEKEIIALVKHAYANKLHVRVRGAGHSMPQAIFTDKCTEDKVDVLSKAPDGLNINIKLDLYHAIERDPDKPNLVTAEAGIHLGKDPIDPNSTDKNSLLYQLNEWGLALGNLGGISHQTAAGFLCTGSSGGSLTHGFHDNIQAIRIIDGTGEPYVVSRDDADQSGFNACLTSLGLLGVISTITFRCDEAFKIEGSELSFAIDSPNLDVDIFDDNPSPPKKGLTEYLKATEYTRILWWPQMCRLVDDGNDRLQIWRAKRIPIDQPLTEPPYLLFRDSEIMIFYSFFMTLTGNLEDLPRVRSITAKTAERFKVIAFEELKMKYKMSDEYAKQLVDFFCRFNSFIFGAFELFAENIKPDERKALIPYLTTETIKLLNWIDTDKKFQDIGYRGLPMDNTADDIVVPVMWTEIWVPVTKCTRVTTLLKKFFSLKELTETNNFVRVGNNGWELYATVKTSAWMAMSYSDESDEWKEGAFRIDPYWFIHNSGSFRDLYRPIWKLLKANNIPFRLHWGKSFPLFEDEEITAKMLVNDQIYPKLNDFLEFRKTKDPQGVFLNDYWCHWLGITMPK